MEKIVLCVVAAFALMAGGAKESAAQKEAPKQPAAPAGFDLEQLVREARKEGQLVAYFTSSRIKDVGDNFEKKYGIKVKGTKMADPEQAERVIREVDSRNVQVDVIGFEDGPLLEGKLLPEGYLVNWMPPDLADQIPKDDQNPLVFLWQPRIFGYNFEAFGDKPPMTNVWEMTEARWKGKILVRDPAQTPANLAFFATIVSNPALMEKAYADHTKRKLEVKEANAGWEFLKRFFQNDVVTIPSDGDIGDAVGAAGQKDAPVGFYTLTKQRDNKTKNLRLATMKGMQPFMGYALPTYALMIKGAPHPNAAKLFIRYILSDGHQPWTVRDMGAFSPNVKAATNPENEGSWADWSGRLLKLDNKVALKLRQEILDFWLQHGVKK